jgi:hypothetical protein
MIETLEAKEKEYKHDLSKQVDHVFGQVDPGGLSSVLSYLSVLIDEQSNAERNAARSLITFLVVWLTAYLISKGLVKESDVGGVKIEKLQALLILVPTVLGFVSYVASSALTVMLVSREAVGLIYDKLIPKLEETDLDTLIMAKTFIGAEEITFKTKDSRVRSIVPRLESILKYVILYCIVMLAWLAPPLAIWHITHLLFEMGDWSAALIFGSATLGVIFWLRGALMIWART